MHLYPYFLEFSRADARNTSFLHVFGPKTPNFGQKCLFLANILQKFFEIFSKFSAPRRRESNFQYVFWPFWAIFRPCRAKTSRKKVPSEPPPLFLKLTARYWCRSQSQHGSRTRLTKTKRWIEGKPKDKKQLCMVWYQGRAVHFPMGGNHRKKFLFFQLRTHERKRAKRAQCEGMVSSRYSPVWGYGTVQACMVWYGPGPVQVNVSITSFIKLWTIYFEAIWSLKLKELLCTL